MQRETIEDQMAPLNATSHLTSQLVSAALSHLLLPATDAIHLYCHVMSHTGGAVSFTPFLHPLTGNASLSTNWHER